MKKILLSALILSASLLSNAQSCDWFDCSTTCNEFTFSGELPTIGGYSNTDDDVCYFGTDATITTGTNYNNWDNLSFTSVDGAFIINQTLNIQSNDNVYFKTETDDTIKVTNSQNFEGTGTINIDGNIILNGIVVNNSFNTETGTKAIINMRSNSWISLPTPNGTIEGFGYDIESLIPSSLKVYNGDLIGYKAEGTLAVGHTTGKFIFFNICSPTPLGINFISQGIKDGKLFWEVNDYENISQFNIKESNNSIDWKQGGFIYPTVNTFYITEKELVSRFYIIEILDIEGNIISSNVIKNNEINKKRELIRTIDVLGREVNAINLNQMHIEQYSDGTSVKRINIIN